jgi:hypothetical protein
MELRPHFPEDVDASALDRDVDLGHVGAVAADVEYRLADQQLGQP